MVFGNPFSPVAGALPKDYSLDSIFNDKSDMQMHYDKLMKEVSMPVQVSSSIYGSVAQADAAVARSNQSRPYTPMDKLKVRLNLHPNEQGPFQHMSAVENFAKGNVVVFLIVNGTPMMLEDDAPLFPSDGLIGKLNTLR
jgi:hypothetical protein